MKKHERKRIQGIRRQQKLALCKRRVKYAYTKAGIDLDQPPHNPNSEVILQVVRTLSTKSLRIIDSNQGAFKNFPMSSQLISLAHDEAFLRAMEVTK